MRYALNLSIDGKDSTSKANQETNSKFLNI